MLSFWPFLERKYQEVFKNIQLNYVKDRKKKNPPTVLRVHYYRTCSTTTAHWCTVWTVVVDPLSYQTVVVHEELEARRRNFQYEAYVQPGRSAFIHLAEFLDVGCLTLLTFFTSLPLHQSAWVLCASTALLSFSLSDSYSGVPTSSTS